MAGRSVITGKPIPSASGVALLARVMIGNSPVTQASLLSITYTVTDLTTGTTLGSGILPVSSVIYDSLVQSDVRWSQDSQAQPSPQPPHGDGLSGYNFLAVLPAALFASRTPAPPDLLAGAVPGHQYQCAVVFTPQSGQPCRVLFGWTEAVSYG